MVEGADPKDRSSSEPEKSPDEDGSQDNDAGRKSPSGSQDGGRVADKSTDGSSKADETKDGGDEQESPDKEDGEAGEDAKKPSFLANPKVRIALLAAGVVAIIGVIAWVINYRNYGRFQQSTNDAYLAADQVNVSARVAGYVEQVLVTDNQVVRAGQLLVRIDRRTSDATAEQSRAQIAQAEATVAQSRAMRVQQYDAIRQALADADQTRATLRQNQATDRYNARQVARYAPLTAVGAETGEKLDQNRSTLEQSGEQVAASRAALSSGTEQVASARHQIAISNAQIRSGQAQVASARAQLAANLVDVDATTVVSRIAGRIGDRTVRVGQYVQVGTRMMTVVPVDKLYLVANFKETQIGLIRVGQAATIEVDALPGEELHGVVESFSPGTGSRFAQVPTDNATGNFTKIVQRVPVRIRVDAGPEARRVLVPGLSVTVSIDTRGARDDIKAQKAETKRTKERRKQLSERELERDQRQRQPGPGR